MNSVVAEIASRFSMEVEGIQRHLAFLHAKHVVDVFEIERLNRRLAADGLPLLPERDFLGHPPHQLTHDEVAALVSPASKACTGIRKTIAEIDPRIDSVGLHIEQNQEDVEVPEFSELVEYVGERIDGDPAESDINLVIDNAARESLEVSDQFGDDDLEDASFHRLSEGRKREVLKTAVHYAIYRRLADHVGRLHETLERLEEIQLIATATDEAALTGLNRLGFIALTAAFDAAVFDLVRTALRLQFFRHACVLGRDQYRLDEIVEAGSWDALRNRIIEQELKKRYVKDLLRLLADSWNVECVPPAYNFARLIEIMNRRNVHLHNRGVVDQKYCEGENLDGLQVGQAAVIDDEYWQRAKDICLYCVRQIAAWADPPASIS